MTPEAVATATAAAVGDLPSRFMLDPATFAAGAEAGFVGVDFYLAGRGGAIGDVPAAVVTAAFVFFAPAAIAEGWERSASVMSRSDAADAWAAACARWATDHLGEPDEADLARLAELVGRMNRAADLAAVPCFAAWQGRPEPADDPRALALHRLMVLRELRGGLHGAAVVAHGLSPHVAVSIRSPGMVAMFGWDAPHPGADDPASHTAWAAAEAATDRALAPAYAALDDTERIELKSLLDRVRAAAT